MKHEIRYDEKHDVVRAKLEGSFTMDEFSVMVSTIKGFFEGKQKRCLLADVTRSERILPSKEERKIMAKESKGLDWDKIAILGADPVLRISSKIILAVIGRSREARFFKTESQALAWLKE